MRGFEELCDHISVLLSGALRETKININMNARISNRSSYQHYVADVVLNGSDEGGDAVLHEGEL